MLHKSSLYARSPPTIAFSFPVEKKQQQKKHQESGEKSHLIQNNGETSLVLLKSRPRTAKSLLFLSAVEMDGAWMCKCKLKFHI